MSKSSLMIESLGSFCWCCLKKKFALTSRTYINFSLCLLFNCPLQSARTSIYTSIYLCLLAIELLFLLGIEQTETSIFCGFITIFLHCAILSGTAWFCYEGKKAEFHLHFAALTLCLCSLPFVLNAHLGRAPDGGGPDAQGELLLPLVLRTVAECGGHLAGHRSQHLYPKRLLRADGGECLVLCHLCNTSACLLCGKLHNMR